MGNLVRVRDLRFDDEITIGQLISSEEDIEMIEKIVNYAITNNTTTIKNAVIEDMAGCFQVVDEIPSTEEQEANPDVFYFVKMSE